MIVYVYMYICIDVYTWIVVCSLYLRFPLVLMSTVRVDFSGLRVVGLVGGD